MTDTAYKEETTHSVTTSESGTSVGAAAASSAESSSSSKRAKCTNEAKRKEESFSMLEQVDRMENIMNKDKLITTKELEDILENCSQTGQYTELTKKIGEGLRSPVNLNHSFLREEVLKATSNGGTAPTLYSASVEDAGIDTGNLRRLMEKIYSLDKEGPKNALVHAYEAAMNEQLIYADDPQRAVNELGDFPLNNAVHLRQFLIVAVDPQCMDPDSHRALKLVYKLADKLKSEARRVFAHWLSNLPAETLTYIVQCAQQFITLRLCQGSATIHEIRPPVNWLSLLHDANEVVHERCGRYPVPYEEFYNDVVSTEVNLEVRSLMILVWQISFIFILCVRIPTRMISEDGWTIGKKKNKVNVLKRYFLFATIRSSWMLELKVPFLNWTRDTKWLSNTVIVSWVFVWEDSISPTLNSKFDGTI